MNIVKKAIEYCGINKAQAAKLCSTPQRTFDYRLKKNAFKDRHVKHALISLRLEIVNYSDFNKEGFEPEFRPFVLNKIEIGKRQRMELTSQDILLLKRLGYKVEIISDTVKVLRDETI